AERAAGGNAHPAARRVQPERRGARHDVAALARQREGRVVDPRHVRPAPRRRRLRDHGPRRHALPPLRRVRRLLSMPLSPRSWRRPTDRIATSGNRGALLLAGCCVTLLASALPAWAAISPTPLPALWGTNGRVWSVVRAGDVAYLGGEFSAMIPSTPGQDPVPTHNLAAVNLTTGRLTSWMPQADGPVYSLATNGTTIFIGGAFANVDGQPRESFAALGRNGALRPWADDVNGRVRCVVVDGADMYLGGRF